MQDAEQPGNEEKTEQEQTTVDGKEQPKVEAAAPKAPPRVPVNVTITDIELENLKKEVTESKDKYLRLLAEQENTRKRLQKEREQLTQYVVQNVIADFLGPIDHFESALKFTEQMSDEVKTWGHGFRMILGQFTEILNQNGVVPIPSLGKHFDPHLHEAVETIETNDCPPGTVVEESLRGYKMGDRTIRPARVKVSKAPTVSPKID